MSTAIIDPTNIVGYPIINMNQNWCDDFDLASANIDNAEASRDGDITGEHERYPDGDVLSSNDYTTQITDAQLDSEATSSYVDEDTTTDNLIVRNDLGGSAGRKAFCGIMGSSSSGDTSGTTVQNWTTFMKDNVFYNLCIWIQDLFITHISSD